MSKYIYSLFFIFIFMYSHAQDIVFRCETTPELEVCQDEVSFETTVVNNTGAILSGVFIEVGLPEGILYQEGSLVELTDYGIAEEDVSDSEVLQFTSGDIGIGDSITFVLNYFASMDAIDFQNSGGVFRNNLVLTHDDGFEMDLSESYNILFPSLSVLDLSPISQSVLSGANTTRSFKLVNAGYGKTDRVYITDVFTTGGTLISSNHGSVDGDTITLTSTDFETIGNLDGYFDNNESIIIEETINGYSCVDITSSSSIKAFWGCSSDFEFTSNSYAHVSVDFQSPNLKLIAEESLESCFGVGLASVQSLMVTNIGSGLASDIVLDIFKSSGGSFDESIYSRFDEGSFQMKVGMDGVSSPVSPSDVFTTLSDGDYSCLGTEPVGRVYLNLPDISPNDTLFIEWDMYSCCIVTCENDKVKGWGANISYTDVCALTDYEKELTGQGVNDQYMTLFTETPTDIEAGEVETYSFIISSFENTLPENENSTYEVHFLLDDDLFYENVSFESNGVFWTPSTVDYDEGENLVVAVFDLPEPFIIPKSELNLELSGSCGSSGWKSIQASIYYNPNKLCEASCLIPLVCDEEVTTYLHCPLVGCEGLGFVSFKVERTNFGAPDNNLDGAKDEIGELDESRIKKNRAMVGDTLRAVAVGKVYSSGDEWSYGYLSTENDFGVHLQVLGSVVSIYDASEDLTHVVVLDTVFETIDGTSQSFQFNFSVDQLAVIDPLLTGYKFAVDDSIQISVDYKVMSSISGLVKETIWENDFYLSNVPNPSEVEKMKCDERFERTTLVGYSWRNDNGSNYTVKSCTKKVKQSFGLSIGDCCSNYAGGNLFPYEYRSWGVVKEALVIIPPNYQLVNTRLRAQTTRSTNSVITTNLSSIVPDLMEGDTLYYDLLPYYESGALPYGDDGFNGFLELELAPNCDVPQNVLEPIVWLFNYQKSDVWGGGETGFVDGAHDFIKYIPSSLSLSSTSPWVDANTKEVTWNLKVKNNASADADNAWLHVDMPENLEVTSIVDEGADEELTVFSDLFLIGSVGNNQTKNFLINGRVLNCDTLLFKVYAGSECVGYPESFESFDCVKSDIDLYVEPKQSAFQVRLFSEPLSDDPCSPLIEVGLDVLSTKIAHMYDMKIDLVSPNLDKIDIKEDSSYFQYNMSNPYVLIENPVLAGTQYLYHTELYEPSFDLQGVPGVSDLENNRFKLKTTLVLGDAFLQGDYAQFRINGKNACGIDLPTIYLDYDPNTKFKKDNTAGLNLYEGDTWSASWGDYDNDGFEDVFVPNKRYDQPNVLYHNNGDGTMAPVVGGSIVSDLGESVSATWGDYDNDGDLDLFVANNTYAQNKLYNNQGDGTFISVLDDPIVDLGLYSHSASWADYDKDGFLDLVVSDIHATHFNFLFRNKQDGSFEEVTSSPINQTASSAVGVSWADYDNDGDLDLFIANTNGENNNLFRNDAGAFVKVLEGDIVNDGGHSIGGAWGDYDSDGDLDLFVTNARDIEPNFFYENNGDGTFVKIVSGVVLSNWSNSHGASWIDYDNDGDLDLLVANDQNQKNYLFSNNGDKTFTKITNAITEELSNSYGTAWADYDNDGDYDLHVSNQGGGINDFFINEKGNCNSYFGIKLEGCRSNRSGVGARVELKATILGEAVWQMREISAQTSALGGQNSFKTIFGLNDATIVDSIVVKWPSGLIQVLTNQEINQIITITEDCGSKICGTVYYDENENGVFDADEMGIPNKEVVLSPGGITVFTNSEGYYQVYVNPEEYVVNQVTDEDWSQTFPLSDGGYTVEVSEVGVDTYCGNDFGNQPSCLDPDLSLSIGATAFRRGLTNDLIIEINNDAAFDASAELELELKLSNAVYLKGDNWISVSEDADYRTYIFAVGPVARLSDTIFSLVDSVDAFVALDLPVYVEGTLVYAGDECEDENNTASVFDVVVGSIDPNDKQVLIHNAGAFLQTKVGDTLLYKIRFQNVGNYAARRVFITDTLSSSLDWSSIEMCGATHSFTTSVNNGVICWVNNNIELPDSSSDALGSNGSVSFKVKIKEGCDVFTEINNRASIQFDYNPFIQTNTTRTIVLPKTEVELYTVYLYPNPTVGSVNIVVLDEGRVPIKMKDLQLTDFLGRTVFSAKIGRDNYETNVGHLGSGSYTVIVRDFLGNRYIGKLIVQ